MKNDFKHILIKGQSLYVIVLFFFLSTGLWLVNKLSSSYETTVPVEVSLVDYNRSNMIYSTDKINIEVRMYGSGLVLLKHHMSLPKIEIPLNKVFPQKYDSLKFALPTNQIKSLLEDQLGDIKVLSIFPDNLHFNAERIAYRKLPVQLNELLTYKEQYTSIKKSIQPDSVWVNGPENVIDTMTKVNTRLWIGKKLDHNVSEYIQLLFPKMVKSQVNAVLYQNNVERVTQNVNKLPIQIIGVPAEVNIKLIPSNTEVYYMVPMSQFQSVRDSVFEVGVLYEELAKSKSGMVKVHILKSPLPNNALTLQYPFVEFIKLKYQK